MKKYLALLIMFYAFSTNAQKTINLYNGSIPNARPNKVEEITHYFRSGSDSVRFIIQTSKPELTIYTPSKEKNTGVAVIICPGGGYTGVAIDHEGHAIAKVLQANGIAAFVLKYRMPNSETVENKEFVPLMDAQRAIQIVRENAASYGVNPNKIGIMGSSAGGHLASTAGTHYAKAQISNPKNTSLRPDFMILNYPVISFADSLTHQGSRFNLIGEMTQELQEKINRDKDNAEKIIASYPYPNEKKIEYSNEWQVNSKTPPCFITHAVDDDVVMVQNSILFIAALQQSRVPVESFFYAKGGHGYGMNNPTSKVQWMEFCLKWLKKR